MSEIRECSGDCEDGQVCIFLSQTSIARCLVPRDANDPTGCGGWCVGEHQLCKRLGNNTYQCADNAGIFLFQIFIKVYIIIIILMINVDSTNHFRARINFLSELSYLYSLF